MRFWTRLLACAAIVTLTLPADAQRTAVNGIADLPRFDYTYTGRVSALLDRSDLLAPLAAKAAEDVTATLNRYAIADRAALRSLHFALVDIAMYRRDYGTARREIAAYRALADKPLERLSSGNLYLAFIDAAQSGAVPGTPAFAAAFQRNYSAAINQLPWSLYGNQAEERVGQDGLMSRAVIVGGTAGLYQPQVDAAGKLDERALRDLIGAALFARDFVPLKAQMLAADHAYLVAKQQRKTDIWPARDVVLGQATHLTPVVVAVWDTGFDTSLFSGRLWSNPREKADGRDDDGDGWIDDVNGIAVDENGQRSPDMLLRPPSEMVARMGEITDRAIGLSDQLANVSSPSARRLVAFFNTASVEDVDRFWRERDYFGAIFHGTHVAGIVARGNPAVRLMTVRRSFTWTTPPRRPTEVTARAYAKAYRDQVAYMRAAGVRLVNMSWSVDVKTEYENQLAANGVPERERAQEAARLFAIEAAGLREAIASAPEILFVCSAGNHNDSAAFAGSVPASLELPNVLTVAAVGPDGAPTDFTTLGPTVDIAANGYRVDSLVPGGRHMLSNGTSMASPNVVNAAAKLLALNPGLTVAQLRSLLLESTTNAGGVHLLNARAAQLRMRQ